MNAWLGVIRDRRERLKLKCKWRHLFKIRTRLFWDCWFFNPMITPKAITETSIATTSKLSYCQKNKYMDCFKALALVNGLWVGQTRRDPVHLIKMSPVATIWRHQKQLKCVLSRKPDLVFSFWIIWRHHFCPHLTPASLSPMHSKPTQDPSDPAQKCTQLKIGGWRWNLTHNCYATNHFSVPGQSNKENYIVNLTLSNVSLACWINCRKANLVIVLLVSLSNDLNKTMARTTTNIYCAAIMPFTQIIFDEQLLGLQVTKVVASLTTKGPSEIGVIQFERNDCRRQNMATTSFVIALDIDWNQCARMVSFLKAYVKQISLV